MKYSPTPLDIAADLRRCIYASLSEESFDDKNVSIFLSHARKDLRNVKNRIENKTYNLVIERIRKSSLTKLSPNKRRENLLMAATLLQSQK